MIDRPTYFDSRETWMKFKEEVEGILRQHPDNDLAREELAEARRVLSDGDLYEATQPSD